MGGTRPKHRLQGNMFSSSRKSVSHEYFESSNPCVSCVLWNGLTCQEPCTPLVSLRCSGKMCRILSISFIELPGALSDQEAFLELSRHVRLACSFSFEHCQQTALHMCQCPCAWLTSKCQFMSIHPREIELRTLYMSWEFLALEERSAVAHMQHSDKIH